MSIGMYRPIPNITTNTPEEAKTLEDFAAILRPVGTEVIVVPEIQRVKFVKNIWNSVMGPILVLTRKSAREIFVAPDNAEGYQRPGSAETKRTSSQVETSEVPGAFPIVKEYTIPLIYDAFQEVAALGCKAFPPAFADGVEGISPDIGKVVMQKVVNLALKSDKDEKLSILVDAELGRPMEVEVIVGEMVRMGRKLDVQMPVSNFGFAKVICQCLRLIVVAIDIAAGGDVRYDVHPTVTFSASVSVRDKVQPEMIIYRHLRAVHYRRWRGA